MHRLVNMKKLFNIFLLLTLLIGSGCVAGRLAPTGVYLGDSFLYQTDFTISGAHTTIRAFLVWEKDNRGLIPAEITQYADSIRRGAPQWFGSAVALRDAFSLNPSGANRTALQQALDVLRQAVVESTKYLVQVTQKPPASPLPVTLTQ